MIDEVLPTEVISARASGARHACQQFFIVGQHNGVISQLSERIPQKAIYAMFDYLWLSSLIDHHRDASSCHRLDCHHTEVFRALWVRLIVFIISGSMPENLGLLICVFEFDSPN